jgi:hypothetical protein
MIPHERAIMELSRLIQPGDVLTLTSGVCRVAVSCPVNPCDFMRREMDKGGIRSPLRYSYWSLAWIVAVRGESCQYPVKLYAITAVERDGWMVWQLEDERMPVQRSLL